MGLAPVPARPAPGFTLADQDGRTMPLSGWRGKVVVLEFMDPHCTDICPLVSQEFVQRPPGRRAQAPRPVRERSQCRTSGELTRPPVG
jgi:hypothetical protein